MSATTAPRGAFVIAWSQTEIDGLTGAPVRALTRGANWEWSGRAVRIDETSGFRAEALQSSVKTYRRRSAELASQLILRALVQEGARSPFAPAKADVEQSFTVTDGRRRWTATLIDVPDLSKPLILFIGDAPPEEIDLKVVSGPESPLASNARGRNREGVVCFTPGTWLDAPGGPRKIEDLVAGDMLYTKDDGLQEILWIGQRYLSSARLVAAPDLRPIRIRNEALGDDRPEGDLIVSPDHRMLVKGAGALALWGEKEVLVAASEMVNDRGILRVQDRNPVTYIHLMLPRHGIVWANGVECESFHPAAAQLDTIAADQLTRLFDVMPELRRTPSVYGPMSRKVLDAEEAALMRRVS
ncbi:MAG: Hint domain-containing protein [Paracoccaceae bacterium]|nr:Hint domain-containing protein [Paracoccaceae bacterium]